jgi:hypothetical protein
MRFARRLPQPRLRLALICLGALLATGCSSASKPTPPIANAAIDPPASTSENGIYRGLDRNDYPGDAAMASLHSTFAFTGFWITPPPGETSNSWTHHRATLAQQGWGFLVLANGRLDAEILKSQKHGISPAQLAQKDAATAIASARAEGFPDHTILFLDQEEGGALLPEQAAYLLFWSEAIAASGFHAGVYASGQPVPNGPGKTITTIQDVRARVTKNHLHPIAFFAYQDSCPPAPGCSLHAKPLAASGTNPLDPGGPLIAWQYAQSPRRPENTKACAATYAADGNCYAPSAPTLFLDLNSAATPDPSHGR